MEGPSRNLPVGPDLVELFIDPQTQVLRLSVTDRKDFYHPVKCSYTRAISNTIGPGIPAEMLSNTKAMAAFLLKKKGTKMKHRMETGDDLGINARSRLLRSSEGDLVYASFLSVLQGDHGGVEYACDAHHHLLASRGLLCPETRLVSDSPFKGRRLMEGLCIDDYFAISIEDKGNTSMSTSRRCFEAANDAYKDHCLLGSPDKDIIDAEAGKVIGAHINALPDAAGAGLVSVGAPPSKRYSLAMISLRVAQLSHTTDALHVCLMGGWSSTLLYRRPLMSLFAESYKLVDATAVEPNNPKMIKLPRSVAQELCLASILVLFAVSNIATPFSQKIYCSDASTEKGAFCSTVVEEEMAEVLWKVSRSKGAYHRLLTPSESLAKRLGFLEEKGNLDQPSPEKPIAYHFDFIEVFAGSSRISDALASSGLVIGPPVDLTHSPEYNMEWVHVISWLTFLVASGRVLAFMCEPPCTTFSIMRRPPLRSRLCPFGFRPRENQTHNGNLLCQRSCQRMQNDAIGLLEKPFTSLMKHMPSYKALLAKDTVFEVRTDSCMFGSIHQKSFALLGFGLDPEPFIRRCDKQHQHVKVEGAYTKASATYTKELAEKIASSFETAIIKKKQELRDDGNLPKGLENQLINSVALESEWKVEEAWTFRGNSHINIKELASVSRLATSLARQGKPIQIRRLNSTMCACDLYINLPFVPTRHNPSHNPTRDVVIRQPLLNGLLPGLHRNALFKLSAFTKLRRWASNWIRLILCLLGVRCLDFNDRSLYRRSRFAATNHLSLPAPNSTCLSTSMDFDATLGFPGEGPSLSAWIALLAMALSWTCSSGLFVCQSCLWVEFPPSFFGAS